MLSSLGSKEMGRREGSGNSEEADISPGHFPWGQPPWGGPKLEGTDSFLKLTPPPQGGSEGRRLKAWSRGLLKRRESEASLSLWLGPRASAYDSAGDGQLK